MKRRRRRKKGGNKSFRIISVERNWQNYRKLLLSLGQFQRATTFLLFRPPSPHPHPTPLFSFVFFLNFPSSLNLFDGRRVEFVTCAFQSFAINKTALGVVVVVVHLYSIFLYLCTHQRKSIRGKGGERNI